MHFFCFFSYFCVQVLASSRVMYIKDIIGMKYLISLAGVLMASLLLLAACSVEDSDQQGVNVPSYASSAESVTDVFEANWSADQQVVDTATVSMRRWLWQAEVVISRLPHAWLLENSALTGMARKAAVSTTNEAFTTATSLEGYGQNNGNYYSLPPQNYSFKARMNNVDYEVEVELKDMNLVVTTGESGGQTSRVSVVLNVRSITCRNGNDKKVKVFSPEKPLTLNSTKKK